MKKILLIAAMALCAASFAQAEGAKDDVTAAAKALADKDNYSWKTSTENAGGGGGGGGGRFGAGPTEGKAEKGGFTHLSMTRGDNTTVAILKDGKGAIKTEDGWKSLTEAADADAGGGQNPARFMARTLQTFKSPAAQALDLLEKVKELKKTDAGYEGELTEEGAKSLMAFGGRRGGGGGQGPNISNPKGTIKFTVKDGVLSKVTYNVKGSVSFNGNDREVDRTTTTEIKDIGTTKLDIPEDAKKKATS